MKRRVVITGMGTVNPLANNVSDTWEAVKAGKCGIAPITHFDASGMKVHLAAEVKNFDAEAILGAKEAKRMDVFAQYAVVAAKEAFEDSKLDMTVENPYRAGCIISSGIGGLSTIEVEHSKGLEKSFNRISPFFIPMTISNMAAGQVAVMCGLKGMVSCVVTACAGANNAIGDAFYRIRDGYEDIFLCGGAEGVINDLAIGGFQSMKALCTSDDPSRASIPFDKERHGFVMGEGAGILVLEEYEHAKKRGAKIYAEIIGYGASCDAYHMTAPDPSGEASAYCIKSAIDDAGININDVDYVNAHGTSTALNDVCETLALKQVFKEHASKLMVSSTKSMTGHLLGAAGAIEAIITALSLRDGFVPATINYQVPDEQCDLDIVPNVGRKSEINVALSNSLGFGGHNATLVFKRG